MITICRYTKEDKDKWNEFNKRAKNSLFMFDRNYMDYHSDRFMDHSLIFYEKNQIIAILPMCERENIFVSHGGLTYGGFITDENMKQNKMLECFECLKEYCKEQAVTKIIYKNIPYIYHSQVAEEDRYALYCCNANILKIEASTVIKLEKTIQMSKLRKRQINKAVQNEIEVCVKDTFEVYKEYILLLNEVLNEHHNVKAVHSAEELFLLHSRFPENIRLYTAYYQKRLIAGTVVFEYEDVIHTQYLASNEQGRNLGALDLVIKSLIDEYEHKKMYLDFGISTEQMGRMLNTGLISQKEGFGGRTITYETWELLIK